MDTLELIGTPFDFDSVCYYLVNMTSTPVNFLGTTIPRQGKVVHIYQTEFVDSPLPVKRVIDFEVRRLPSEKENTIYIVDPEVAQLITDRPDVFSLNPLLHVVEKTDELAYGSFLSFYKGPLSIGPELPWN